MAATSSSPSYSSLSSIRVRVDKATSESLNDPDYFINIDICDTINAYPWLAEDVIKTLEMRLPHMNPNVQLLCLTLLDTMVKNCGDTVHLKIAELNILTQMVKIVKRKKDVSVREKILNLLEAWKEMFGVRGGKYTRYYSAYDELRKFGVEFPNASHLRAIKAMESLHDRLSHKLQQAVKDKVIVELVDRCRSNQKELTKMLIASTSDSTLIGRGTELNNNLLNILANHDAIASGPPIPYGGRTM